MATLGLHLHSHTHITYRREEGRERGREDGKKEGKTDTERRSEDTIENKSHAIRMPHLNDHKTQAEEEK